MIVRCIQLSIVPVIVTCFISCSSKVGFIDTTSAPPGETGLTNAAIIVVEKYMLAVRENRRSDAEKLVLKPEDKYPRRAIKEIDSNRLAVIPNTPDWYGFFRDRDFILTETKLLEISDSEATVKAKCIVPERRAPEFPQTVIFRLIKKNDHWSITNIDLSFDELIDKSGPKIIDPSGQV